MRFNIYSTGHPHSREVCKALATGTGFPIVAPSPLLPGGVVMYGFLRGLLRTLREAIQQARPWVYADRGYFRASYGTDYSGYFRITRDHLQHDGSGEHSMKRWKTLGLTIEPWKETGVHVLVCPPGDVFSEAIGGFKAIDWLAKTLTVLKANTSRPIIIRHKAISGERPLSLDLRGCHAVVTFMSNVAVESVLAGVPVFCTGQCAASRMGLDDLSMIESPIYPDREQWAANLAANQWTLTELRSGAAYRLFGEEKVAP